jgi:hypothetical protein
MHLTTQNTLVPPAQFAEVLSEREMRDLLHRRNYVLRYLDRLVEDQGYAATVVEDY